MLEIQTGKEKISLPGPFASLSLTPRIDLGQEISMASTDSPNASLTPGITHWREAMSSLRAGVAQREFTPKVGIASGIWGAAKKSRSESIHIGLFLTAIAREDGDRRKTFIVGIDLCVLGCAECADDMLDRIAEGVGVSRDQILFSSSHTHAVPLPCIHRPKKDGSELIPEFRDLIINKTIEACLEAASKIADVDITWGYGHCDLAVNRDLPCGEVEVVAFNPEIPADDTLTVGRVSTRNGKVIATIANYACHPTTLAWENMAISPDYIGMARIIVESETKAPMLFLQGASGELSPRNQYSGDTALADRNGAILGHAIMSTLKAMQSPGYGLKWNGIVESGALLGEWHEEKVTGSSQAKEFRIDVPVRVKEMKTIEQLREEWAGIDPDALEERITRATRLRIGYESNAEVTHPVWIWQWGEAIFVAQPGEAYSYIQTELRKRNPGRIIFVVNLTNAPGLFYLPIRSAYNAPAYQAWQTLLAPGCIEVVTDYVDKEIKKIK